MRVERELGLITLAEDAGSQMGDFSRRTSYYGGMSCIPCLFLHASNNLILTGQNGASARYDPNNYYGPPSRPDSIVNGYQNAPQSPENPYPYTQNGYSQNGYQHGRRPSRHPRGSPSSPLTPSDGYPNIANNVNNPQYGYPQSNGYQRSYDNVTAMNNGLDTPGQYTDPNSMNSSADQLQQQALQQQRLDERAQAEYGFNGFGANKPQPLNDPSWGGPVGQTSAPAPSTLRNVNQPPVPEKADKRKSWFKRRFSKD